MRWPICTSQARTGFVCGHGKSRPASDVYDGGTADDKAKVKATGRAVCRCCSALEEEAFTCDEFRMALLARLGHDEA